MSTGTFFAAGFLSQATALLRETVSPAPNPFKNHPDTFSGQGPDHRPLAGDTLIQARQR